MTETKRPEVGLYPINGKFLPGNSSVVDYGLGIQDGLVGWIVKQASIGIAREYKKQKKFLTQKEAIDVAHETRHGILTTAGALGTKQHTNAYNLINGLEVGVSPEEDAYYRAFFNWYKEHDVRPLMMEKLLWDEVDQFAGRFDFYGYVDGKLTLMDFKTNNNVHPKMGLQLAGYKHLLEVNQFEVPEQTLILHIRPGMAYTIPFCESYEAHKNVQKVFWWKFYRYKPATYIRSTQDAVEKSIKKGPSEDSPVRPQTLAVESPVPSSEVRGRPLRPEEEELSPNFSEKEEQESSLSVRIYPGQEDTASPSLSDPSSPPVRKRGRPRKVRPLQVPSDETSLHRVDFQQGIPPEEVELDPLAV